MQAGEHSSLWWFPLGFQLALPASVWSAESTTRVPSCLLQYERKSLWPSKFWKRYWDFSVWDSFASLYRTSWRCLAWLRCRALANFRYLDLSECTRPCVLVDFGSFPEARQCFEWTIWICGRRRSHQFQTACFSEPDLRAKDPRKCLAALDNLPYYSYYLASSASSAVSSLDLNCGKLADFLLLRLFWQGGPSGLNSIEIRYFNFPRP